MDIIGKVYKDYFCEIQDLDGNSHLLNKHNSLIGILGDSSSYSLIRDWNNILN